MHYKRKSILWFIIEFITQLQIYAKVVRILAKGYISISLVMPYKLQEIINSVKKTH